MKILMKRFGLPLVTETSAITILLTASTLWAGTNAWTKIGPDGANIVSVAIDPRNPRNMYVSGSGRGSLRSTDGGATWNVMDTGPYALRLMIDPKNPTTIYATQPGFVLKSTDAGASWVKMGQPALYIMGFAIDPRNMDTVYAFASNSNGFGSNDNPFGEYRVFKSTDGASTWARTTFEPGNLVFDPQNPSNLYTWRSLMDGCCTAVFKSTDEGATWVKILDSVTGFIDAQTGIHIWAFDMGGMMVDPHNPSTLWIGNIKSTDAGTSWFLDHNMRSSTLLLDPHNPGTIYAAPYDPGDPGRGQVLLKSTDGGTSWSTLPDSGLDGRHVDGLFIDPKDPNTLYALAWGDLFVITLEPQDK